MSYKNRFFILLFCVIVFLSGFFIGNIFTKRNIQVEKEKIFSSCWDEARKQLIGTCRPISEMTQNLVEKNFYGNLIDLDLKEKKVIVDPAPLSDGEDNISSLILKISSNTVIEKIIKKDDALYQEELKKFNADFINNPDALYPLQYSNKKVDFEAFEIGQSITILSDSDIRNKKEVTALKVIINYQD